MTTVRINKPQINIREKLNELDRPVGLAGAAMLRAETPQEQFDLIKAGRRNLLDNGDQRVKQRPNSSVQATVAGNYYLADRWQTKFFGGGFSGNHHTISHETDAPDGFAFSTKITTNIAQNFSSALGSWFSTNLEGHNLIPLASGSGSKPFTVSFWVKSNVRGNVSVSAEGSGSGYSYSTFVTINDDDTWEYKTVTFPANPLNQDFDYTATNSDFSLKFGLGSDGSWLVDTDNQWSDKTNNRGVISPQQTNFMANVNNYIQFTGIQMEVGEHATEYEYRSYATELAECQRYLYVIDGPAAGDRIGSAFCFSSTGAIVTLPLPVTMRAKPTLDAPSGTLIAINDSITAYTSTAISLNGANKNFVSLNVTTSGMTAGRGAQAYFSSTNTDNALVIRAEP